MPSVGVTRRRWREIASARGINPRDADVLLGDLLGKPFSWIIAHEDADVTPAISDALDALMQRRLRREPLQYIRGKTEFYGRDFLVDARVLIPRPETEHLVEEAIARIARGGRVLDIGTGSGSVAISIALERPDVAVFGSDVSPGALAAASRNAGRLDARLRLFGSNVCEAIGAGARFDAIVSNPPYIPGHEMAELQPEVREFEPEMALTPGKSGLEVVERILERAPRLLEPGGIILLEIGQGQNEAVASLAVGGGWSCAFKDDLQGIARVAVLSK